MSNRLPFVKRPWLAALLAVCGLGLLTPAAGASAPAGGGALNGWLSTGPTFPGRAVVMLPPAGRKLSAGSVQVTEDGAPVHGLTVTPLSQAQSKDFGLVVVLDQGLTMSGRSTTAEFGAVRSLVRSRRAGQELGVVGVDGTPSVIVPLTSSSSVLDNVLAASPGLGGKSDLGAGVRSAISQLSQAQVAMGAVVVVSDGADLRSIAGSAAAAAAASAARIPVFTVGLKDGASSAASLASLSEAVPGRFVSTPVSGLPGVFKAIYTSVTRGYVARWHSAINSNRTVTVSAQVKGLTGSVAGSYAVSGLHPASASSQAAHASDAGSSGHLATTPAFAPGVVSPQAPAAPPTTQSFWASSSAVPAVAGLAALLFGLALMFALYRPSQRAVRVRVGSFIPSHDEIEDDLGMGTERGGMSLLRMFEHGKWWPPFVLDVDISRSPHTPVALVKRAAAMSVLVAVVIYLVSGSGLIAFLAIIGWPFTLRWWVKRGARKQRDKFKESLPNYLQDLSSAIRVGRSFNGALTVVAESADEPTKSELEHAITDEALGRPIDEALEAVAIRMEAVDLSQVALIAALNRRSGSNVAEALERVAEGARERADLRREVKALTAQAKMSSSVLTALPGLMLLGVNLISAKYAWPLMHTTLGLVLLGVGACMVWAGWKVMSKITHIKI